MNASKTPRHARTSACFFHRLQIMRRLSSAFVVLSFLFGSPLAAQTDSFSLDGLVVTTSPTARSADAIANHVTVLTGSEIRAAGVRSLIDVLADVPGVAIARPGSFGAVSSLFLRGGESDHTLVLIDGVQVNQAGGGFDFAALSTDNIERIEIVRGPTSAVYGSDAVAGVIHIITRLGRGAPVATGRMEAGSFGRTDWGASVRAGTERAGYSVSVERQAVDGIFDFNNTHRITTVSGVARMRPDAETDLKVNVRLVDREYHFPTDGSGTPVDQNAFSFQDAFVGQIAVSRVFAPRLSLRAALGVNETDGGTDDAQDSPADTLGFYGFTSLDDFRRSVADVRADVTTGYGVLSIGYEYEHQQQRSFNESMSQFGPSNGRSESERTNHAGIAHYSGTAGVLSYNAGTRLEDNERFGQQTTWQLGVAAAVSRRAGTTVRASVGTAIKEPTFFENFASGFTVGNPDLDPERSTSWEVGIDQTLAADRVHVRATWFDQSFEDLIQYTFAPPTPGDPNFYNVAAADARGLELVSEARAGRVTGGVSWTRLTTEVIDSGFDEGEGATFVDGAPLLRRPKHTVAVHGRAEMDAVQVTARYTRVGSRADRDFSTFPASPVTLDGYGLLAVGVQWQAVAAEGNTPGLTFVVRGENLLDEMYEHAFGFASPGRGLYVGGSIDWGAR